MKPIDQLRQIFDHYKVYSYLNDGKLYFDVVSYERNMIESAKMMVSLLYNKGDGPILFKGAVSPTSEGHIVESWAIEKQPQ
jgi:hypothetical protein